MKTIILSTLAILFIPIITLAEPRDGSLVKEIKMGDDLVIKKLGNSRTDFVTCFKVGIEGDARILRLETSKDQIHCGSNNCYGYTIEGNGTYEVKLTVTCDNGNYESVWQEFKNGYGKQFKDNEMLLCDDEMAFFVDATLTINNSMSIPIRTGQTWNAAYNYRHLAINKWFKTTRVDPQTQLRLEILSDLYGETELWKPNIFNYENRTFTVQHYTF